MCRCVLLNVCQMLSGFHLALLKSQKPQGKWITSYKQLLIRISATMNLIAII